MLIRYIYMGLFSLVFLSGIFLDLLYRKEIKYISDQDLEIGKFEGLFISGIFVFVGKNSKVFSRLVNNKIRDTIIYFYDSKYYRFYENLYLSKKISLMAVILLAGLFLLALSNEKILILLILLALISVYFLYDIQQYRKYERIKSNMKIQLPNLLTRLTLLIDAGITYRKAIEIIVDNQDDELSKEIRKVLDRVENGESEKNAYKQLAKMSEDPLIRKFVSLIVQNIYKGSEDFPLRLNELRVESFNYSKSVILERSQKAGQKLLIPNLIIFTGIISSIMLPILFKAI